MTLGIILNPLTLLAKLDGAMSMSSVLRHYSLTVGVAGPNTCGHAYRRRPGIRSATLTREVASSTWNSAHTGK